MNNMMMRGIAGAVYFIGGYLATGLFWPSAILAAAAVIWSWVGFGSPTVQALGVVLFVYGVLRVFGGLPF